MFAVATRRRWRTSEAADCEFDRSGSPGKLPSSLSMKLRFSSLSEPWSDCTSYRVASLDLFFLDSPPKKPEETDRDRLMLSRRLDPDIANGAAGTARYW